MKVDRVLDRWVLYFTDGSKHTMAADSAKYFLSIYPEVVGYVECFDTPIMVMAKRLAEELFYRAED